MDNEYVFVHSGLNPIAGIRCGNEKHNVCVVTYADELTLLFTDQQDINVTLQFIRTYEVAGGAGLKIQKSKAVAVGSWGTSISGTNFSYYQDIAILGFRFGQTVDESHGL